MKHIKIKKQKDSRVVLLEKSLKKIEEYCKAEKKVIITDKNVKKALGSIFPKYKIIEIGVGEQFKTLDTVQKIYEKFLELELERSSLVIGIGGGIVCDVTGFAASTYLRGLNFGFVPTTLLAQVDASIGGKNGVNFKGYKNLIGTITQPKFILYDFKLLETLPLHEIKNGFAEVIKHAVIKDRRFFSYLEKNYEKALSLNRKVIKRIVYTSLKIKTTIVKKDETEKNERRKLNFGHTIGHALEKTNKISHGEAISIGMVAAAKLSELKGLLKKEEVEKISDLIVKFGLPVKIRVNDKEKIIDAIKKDKKREKGKINFVLLKTIGNAKIIKINIKELEAVLNDMCQHS